MELTSLFSDDLESVPVSWRAQGSTWLFCTQQFGAVPFPWSISGHSVSVFCGNVCTGVGKAPTAGSVPLQGTPLTSEQLMESS